MGFKNFKRRFKLPRSSPTQTQFQRPQSLATKVQFYQCCFIVAFSSLMETIWFTGKTFFEDRNEIARLKNENDNWRTWWNEEGRYVASTGNEMRQGIGAGNIENEGNIASAPKREIEQAKAIEELISCNEGLYRENEEVKKDLRDLLVWVEKREQEAFGKDRGKRKLHVGTNHGE
ncbi:hypothetical protein BTUL_0049g00040 [Botrytis tulipae]|uniref:Uncharacterized protein n=1 Tax=Botrytis tulipae TaxID=87230 RepID=A0A4Z1ER60_9HELO|nr:hypothetical protein BTUL_0049g00040 [Botrytis tulipae]